MLGLCQSGPLYFTTAVYRTLQDWAFIMEQLMLWETQAYMAYNCFNNTFLNYREQMSF